MSALEVIKHPLNIAEVVAYGYVGSRLYGLITDESDTDLALITRGKAKSTQKVIDDMDYRIYSLDSFAHRLQDTRMSETDLLLSGAMTILDPAYEAYFHAFRVNSLKYVQQCEAHISFALRQVTPAVLENHVQYKALKSAVRCAMLEAKMVAHRDGFNPVFSENEQDTYWELMKSFTSRIQNGESAVSLAAGLHGICYKNRGIR
ncbi:MAG: hypothetical protein H9W81_13605 [Enterococcus sp.]|nr:hypothetical protein [Enterococcus sp.]